MAALINFDHLDFLSLSTLLSAHQVQQAPICRYVANEGGSSCDEDEDEVEDKDVDSKGVDHEDGLTMLDELSKLSPKDKRVIKFLDHIAETFAREKSLPPRQAKRRERRNGSRCGRGAHHVSAAGMIMEDQAPTIYVAKNGGTDDLDKELAKNLTKFLRVIAATAKRPAIEKDTTWKRLVSYSKQRLDIYAIQVASLPQPDLVAAFVEGSDGASMARELHSLATTYRTESSLDTLERMIALAYRLRYESTNDALSPQSKKANSSACFLGRLRAAYETFKETAIEFQKPFTKVTIVCLPAPDSQLLDRPQLEKRVGEMARISGTSIPRKASLINILGKGADILTPCHAEVQLLLHFECSPSPTVRNSTPWPYIGCSKNSCWLCHQLLSRYRAWRSDKRGFYQTRGSHGKVYPLWHLSLHVDSRPDPRVRFYLSVALCEIRELILQRLRSVATVKQPNAVAESSANITLSGSSLKRRALAKQRVAESSSRSEDPEVDMRILKDLVCSKKCLRVPADRSVSPHLQSINLYRYPDNYPRTGHETKDMCIPDFGAYWGTSCNFERSFRRFTMEEAEVKGEYLLYWCRNSELLPPNQHLMSLLDIESVGIGDEFWYGDVFITRFHEEKDPPYAFTSQDVPDSILGQQRSITLLIRHLWKIKAPAEEITSWQYFETLEEKMKTDKEILLQRMSPAERRILEKEPWMLEYLSLSACDDGALVDSSVTKDSNNPEMVQISTRYRLTAMEERGWKGFSSEDL